MTVANNEALQDAARVQVRALLDAIDVPDMPVPMRVRSRGPRRWQMVGLVATAATIVAAVVILTDGDKDELLAVASPDLCEMIHAAGETATIGETISGDPVVLRVHGAPPAVESSVQVGDRSIGSMIHVESSWYSLIERGDFGVLWAYDHGLSVVNAHLPIEAAVLEVVDDEGRTSFGCPVRFSDLPIAHAAVVLADGARPAAIRALDSAGRTVLEWPPIEDPGGTSFGAGSTATVDPSRIPLPIGGIQLPPYEPTPLDDPTLVDPLLTGEIGSDRWELRAFTYNGVVGISLSTPDGGSLDVLDPAAVQRLEDGEPYTWQAAVVGSGLVISGPLPPSAARVRVGLTDGSVVDADAVQPVGVSVPVFAAEIAPGGRVLTIEAVDEGGTVLLNVDVDPLGTPAGSWTLLAIPT